MRTIINFNELYDAVGKVAAEFGKEYFQVEVQQCSKGLYSGKWNVRKNGVNLRGYIDGFEWADGSSIEELVNALTAQKRPPIVENNLEVEVELQSA